MITASIASVLTVNSFFMQFIANLLSADFRSVNQTHFIFKLNLLFSLLIFLLLLLLSNFNQFKKLFMKKIFILSLCFLCFVCSTIYAQYIPSAGAADIIQSLKKLNTLGTVLYVAAHPDDENTRLLGYMSKEKNVRTGYISMTRGDGGQNLIGKEQGELLGLIRTQELLAARRTDGAEQFFTRANDFGYSKNPEETMQFWNKDSILGDLVWTIRKFKPDVIINRFPTTGEGGHGHHTASAILAVEAFTAAADPKQFPEQLAYTEVWQPRRLFFNAFNFGGANTTSPDQLKLDVGVFNPVLGNGYGEIAAESRSFHKSQGFGSSRGRGSNNEFFKQLKGDSVSSELFEKIDLTWTRLPGAERIKTQAELCLKKFDPLNPVLLVPDLVSLYGLIWNLSETSADVKYWKNIKLKETEALIIACSGLWVEAVATDFSGVPGNKIMMNLQVIKRNEIPVSLNKISFFEQTDTVTNLNLKFNELYSFNHSEIIPQTMDYSSPYWLNEKHDAGRYHVGNRQLIGQPENTLAPYVVFDLEIAGLKLRIAKPLIYKYTDPVKGEIYRIFELLPPVTVNINEKILVYADTAPKQVRFVIKANTNSVKGKLQVDVPVRWSLRLNTADFELKNKGDEITLEGTLFPLNGSLSGPMHASVLIDSKLYTKSIQRIEYDHIPYQFVLKDASIKILQLNLKMGKTSIGYIPGAGDEIPTCLEQIGYKVTILTDDLLASQDLTAYNAIITGIRAYNTNEKLQIYYTKLMDYVNKGGNLIVQYNTNSRFGPVPPKVGPFPFTISRDRVTDENAAVKIVQQDHLVFNAPNKIDEKDFEGWVQERGIYFATECDSAYQQLLAMHDPGEKDVKGSLIIAKYGKGNFVYTGLAFFRQLPAGVPGAYRLFTNLISISANP